MLICFGQKIPLADGGSRMIFDVDANRNKQPPGRQTMSKAVVNPKRVRQIKAGTVGLGPVVYWMSRDQRLADNWALLYAQQIATEHKMPLAIVFCLVPEYLGATIRQYDFMLKGLQEVETAANKRGTPFILLTGSPEVEIPRFARRHKIGAVVADFSPLRVNRQWQQEVARQLSVPFFAVDAHNIVPCWVASDKQEYAAYTLRPKLRRLLPEFLEEFPPPRKHPFAWQATAPQTDWQRAYKTLKVDKDVAAIEWLRPGEKAANRQLDAFASNQLAVYDAARNDPNAGGQSNLSPYLHFGQIAAQRVALTVQRHDRNLKSQEAFLEELIVRRELADNFCLYNDVYDRFEGFPPWAQKTLDEHRGDPRTHRYSQEQFERAGTHDELWNAAQMEMVQTGKMHGYLRMYWAKKILEWTTCPEEAMEVAISLNDKYELDGRDPNGYAGIAWSVGGVHDRAWFERDIFGKIRYMSRSGCERKFDVKAYIARHLPNAKGKR